MLIENVLSKIEKNKMVKQPFLKDHSRQMIALHIPAGMELKLHVSKVDALLVVEEGQALFTLWIGDVEEKFEINVHDVVAFKADQLHAVLAVTDFTAFVIK
jgi:quercetin dioxygenase-like cupin family protein